MTRDETTGWKRAQYGTWYKEIDGLLFRLWRERGYWRITFESIVAPEEKTLTGAKRLAHRMARKMTTP